MKRILIATLAVLAFPLLALAHVSFDHADPKVGSKVGQPPTEVRIWFSDDVDASCCGIEVLDASGKRVDKCDCHVDAKDKSEIIVSLPTLGAGTYKVVWRAACVDKHKVKGSFKFAVK
jgi:methionine-rich copper-binding protein CopC